MSDVLSNKKRAVPARIAILAIFLIVMSVVGYAFFVGPFRLETTVHQLAMGVRSSVTILQISDLHSSGLNRREAQILDIVERLKPDMIVVTGDSVTSGANCMRAAETLDRLSAPLGVWIVPGNWEYWMSESQGSSCLCPSVKATCLRNQAVKIRDDLWVVGIDDLMEGNPSIRETIMGVPEHAEMIVLAHEPTAFKEVTRRALVLSGHTHGGQICLPFVGALLLPPESGGYESGWYGTGARRMYVSRGVGTSVVPARLVCGPEVALFEIAPISKSYDGG
jgi:predicted MPP superfamily phosphohydrolase